MHLVTRNMHLVTRIIHLVTKNIHFVTRNKHLGKMPKLSRGVEVSSIFVGEITDFQKKREIKAWVLLFLNCGIYSCN